MRQRFKQLCSKLQLFLQSISLGKNAITGASLGILLGTLFLWVVFSLLNYINLKDPWILLFQFLILLGAILFGFVVLWSMKLLNKVPKPINLAIGITLPLLFSMSFEWITPFAFLTLLALCGAVIAVLNKTKFRNLSTRKKIITTLGLLIGFGGITGFSILYAKKGFEMDSIENAVSKVESQIENIDAVSPLEKGPYQVNQLTYGSGTDRHRVEFSKKVSFRTDSVNGVAFLDNWEGFGGWWRTKYWGFDSKSLPLNARVWYPEGDGPFPLALIVHGNHSMQDYSDGGYAYLGELLASKGIILASVDENFLNGSWSDFLGELEEENDARAWLLLEHLRVWHEWNSSEEHMFYNKIDMDNIALIGHSRGGEAVAHAALFNTLPFYPDDASIPFNYNYNIKSIVAIAPVDGQYAPGKKRTILKDLNYLTIHGSQDGDVTSFAGSKQYERIQFQDSSYHFKSGIYIQGANHGQFNTSWGNNDSGNPLSGFLNFEQLLSKQDQENIAKVFITSFFDITLKNKTQYLPLFLDARKGKDWLPKTIYINQFQDSNLDIIANFEEDFDVTTTTGKKGSISSTNLSVWKEQEIQLKRQQKGSKAVFIGWNNTSKDNLDSEDPYQNASYSIAFGDKKLDSTSVLTFSMAESQESSNPKLKGKWLDERNENDNIKDQAEVNKPQNNDKQELEEKQVEEPIDFTIQITDGNGERISFPLSTFSTLQRELEVMILKTGFLTGEKESEKAFQTFYFPLEKLQNRNPKFDLESILEIRFIFDKTEEGVVCLDDLGFMKEFQ